MAMQAYTGLCSNITAVTDDSMVVLQDCLDSEKDGSVSCSEACSSSSHSGAQAINIKVEEIQAMEDRENPVSVSFGGLGAEHEVRCLFWNTARG